MNVWTGKCCHYCGTGARAYVYWTHSLFDHERHTCYHHGRTKSLELLEAGWIRVTENEWYEEEPKLQGAL